MKRHSVPGLHLSMPLSFSIAKVHSVSVFGPGFSFFNRITSVR